MLQLPRATWTSTSHFAMRESTVPPLMPTDESSKSGDGISNSTSSGAKYSDGWPVSSVMSPPSSM